MARRSQPSTPRRRPATGRPPKRRHLTDEQRGRIIYRDPEFLRLFVTDGGRIRSRRLTGLSRVDQTRLAKEVKRARELAYLPYPSRPSTIEGRKGGRGRP